MSMIKFWKKSQIQRKKGKRLPLNKANNKKRHMLD